MRYQYVGFFLNPMSFQLVSCLRGQPLISHKKTNKTHTHPKTNNQANKALRNLIIFGGRSSHQIPSSCGKQLHTGEHCGCLALPWGLIRNCLSHFTLGTLPPFTWGSPWDFMTSYFPTGVISGEMYLEVLRHSNTGR